VELSAASGHLLAGLLEARTGQQLPLSRRWRIAAVLQPLARERGFKSLDDLAAAVAAPSGGALADAAVEALLNNETFFCRDRAAFDLLLGPALARLEQSRTAERRLSIWCAGCSTGQEAYTLAMHFAGQRLRWQGWKIDILATDVSKAAIAQARSGLYSQFEVQRGLSAMEMLRWFEQQPGSSWRIAPELRRAVRFEVHSLASEPPPGPFDIILCRNVLLYFSAAMRRTVFDRLAAAAAPDAVLMLGAGETVGGRTDAFVSDPECRGLFVPSADRPTPRRAAS
jgi:chemotaxis protein methyltransferase CheR